MDFDGDYETTNLIRILRKYEKRCYESYEDLENQMQYKIENRKKKKENRKKTY